MRLQVDVRCPRCPSRSAGTYQQPLPEMYSRWLLATWQLEQALHHAEGCDHTIKLTVTRTSRIEPDLATQPE